MADLRLIALVFVCTSFWFCSETKESATDLGSKPVAVAERVKSEGFVLSTTMLRKQPTLDKRVDDPNDDEEKQVSNWLATLYRGEIITLLKKEGDWWHVDIMGEKKGWLRQESVLVGDEVHMKTLLSEARVFRRADLLSLENGKKLPTGSLLFSRRSNEQFTRVNYPRGAYTSSEAWVLTNKLSDDSRELAASKILTKIRNLADKKNQAVLQEMVSLARESFPDAELLEYITEFLPAQSETTTHVQIAQDKTSGE
jgi:hypothetical protein